MNRRDGVGSDYWQTHREKNDPQFRAQQRVENTHQALTWRENDADMEREAWGMESEALRVKSEALRLEPEALGMEREELGVKSEELRMKSEA